MASTLFQDIPDHDESIVLPEGEIDSHVFATQIRDETLAAIRTGRLYTMPMPDLFELAMHDALTTYAQALSQLPDVNVDAAPSAQAGWWARLKYRLRVSVDRLIVYYISRQAIRQSDANLHARTMWLMLTRQFRAREETWHARVDELQSELARLRNEVAALRAKGVER